MHNCLDTDRPFYFFLLRILPDVSKHMALVPGMLRSGAIARLLAEIAKVITPLSPATPELPAGLQDVAIYRRPKL